MKHLSRLTWVIGLVVVALIVLAATIGASQLNRVSSFADCVAAGNPIMESYPRQCRDGEVTYVEDVPPQNTVDLPSSQVSESGNIRVDAPVANATIGSPLVVTGQARVFENTVEWKLLDQTGVVLAAGFTTAEATDIGQFGPFRIEKAFTLPKSAAGTLEVYSTSARDGSVIDLVRMPVQFGMETQTVKAFFSDKNRDPQMLNCATTYPVDRTVGRTAAPARAALEQLLGGLTRDEAGRGFITNLPAGVRILSLVIDGDTATVDLSSELQSVASGSCRVGAIRSQIENTLKQFPNVKNVEILIAGKADVLEP